jgi:ornithine cyclodeaminase/alanine dehydrogenase-like protein (mu-crystallin family)
VEFAGSVEETSVYAAEEARRNLGRPKQPEGLEELLSSAEVIATAAPTDHPLISTTELPDKDQPILLAAIGAGAPGRRTYSPADFRHFGRYCGETTAGVLILSPGDYLSSRTG